MNVILNLLGYLLVIIINFLANYLPINGQQTGEISDKLDVLFTPAGYVFSIWGLIYILTGIWVLAQIPKSRRNSPVYKAAFPWFLISCLLNSAWIFAWHYEYFPLSVLIIAALLITLIVLYERIKAVPHSWWELAPFSIYLGWISVAAIANISFTLKDAGWNGFGLSDTVWTIIMLAVAALLAIVFKFRNRDWLYPLVFVWAFIGIGVRNAEDYSTVSYIAYGLAAVIFIAAIIPQKKRDK